MRIEVDVCCRWFIFCFLFELCVVYEAAAAAAAVIAMWSEVNLSCAVYVCLIEYSPILLSN